MKKHGACYLGLLVGLLATTTPLLAQQNGLPDPAAPDPVAPSLGIPNQVAEDPVAPDRVEKLINSCADFDTTGSVYELTGTTTVLGTISCSPRVAVSVKEGNAVLRSDKALDTHGLHIVVQREAKLTITAPAVHMQRAKDDAKKGTLLIVKGQLDFEVTSSTPAFLGASEDDIGDAIKVGPKGRIRCDQAMRFSEDSVIVAKPPPSDEGTVDQAGDPIPVTQELLEEPHSTTSTSDETGPSTATSATASSRTSGTTQDNDGAPADNDGEETSSSVPPSSSTTPTEKDEPPTDTEPDSEPAEKDAPIPENASSSPTLVDVKAVIARVKTSRSKDDEIFQQFDKLFQQSHVEATLKVGQPLSGRLRSLEKTTAIYPGHVDGCIRFERSTGAAPVDARGRPTGPVSKEVTTLAKAKFAMLRRVYQLRQDISEDAEQARKSKKLAPLLKWLPFGEHGFREERARRRAREHLKEVFINVTDRGRVEVSMDGIVVLRISGPSFLGYRPRDCGYELRTTTKGLEVLRRGKLDWSLDADFT